MIDVTEKSESAAPAIAPVKAKRGRPRTSPTLAERSTAIALADRGMSMRQIAQVLARDPETISRILKDARATLAGGVAMAADAVLLAAQIAALKGDHRPAWAILENAGVVERQNQGDAGGVRIQIGIALPGIGAAVPVSGVVNRSGEYLEGETLQQDAGIANG